jgi:hypothetical protein
MASLAALSDLLERYGELWRRTLDAAARARIAHEARQLRATVGPAVDSASEDLKVALRQVRTFYDEYEAFFTSG